MGSMKNQTMDEKIGVRIPKEWRLHLEEIIKNRPPGTKLSDLAREAIYQVYPLKYPIREITALRAAEMPKKSINL